MTNHQHYSIEFIRPDGSTQRVFKPLTAVDVEQQPDVPADILATLAFAPIINGSVAFSRFTRFTMGKLYEQFGDEILRKNLIALLTEMTGGFKPKNPVGIFIHRVRLTATETVIK